MTLRLSAFAIVCSAFSLTGCGSVADNLLVDRGTLAYYRCDDIARAMPGRLAREQELKGLMTAAEQDPFGGAIASLAYQDEYAKTRAEIRFLAESAKEKRCEGMSVTSPKPGG